MTTVENPGIGRMASPPQKIMTHSLQLLLCQSGHEHCGERDERGGGQCGKISFIAVTRRERKSQSFQLEACGAVDYSATFWEILCVKNNDERESLLAKLICQYETQGSELAMPRFYENTTKVNGAYLAAESSWVWDGPPKFSRGRTTVPPSLPSLKMMMVGRN